MLFGMPSRIKILLKLATDTITKLILLNIPAEKK